MYEIYFSSQLDFFYSVSIDNLSYWPQNRFFVCLPIFWFIQYCCEKVIIRLSFLFSLWRKWRMCKHIQKGGRTWLLKNWIDFPRKTSLCKICHKKRRRKFWHNFSFRSWIWWKSRNRHWEAKKGTGKNHFRNWHWDLKSTTRPRLKSFINLMIVHDTIITIC